MKLFVFFFFPSSSVVHGPRFSEARRSTTATTMAGTNKMPANANQATSRGMV
jgi:hypothetical protein